MFYYFHCTLCRETGGFFSRQAWGWGNFDIIESFKFLAAHTPCDSITIIHEDKAEAQDEQRWEKRLQDKDDSVYHYFPHSNDYPLIRSEFHNIDDMKRIWFEQRFED
jgi:hypothetical protein